MRQREKRHHATTTLLPPPMAVVMFAPTSGAHPIAPQGATLRDPMRDWLSLSELLVYNSLFL
jgi:hypothetical protein